MKYSDDVMSHFSPNGDVLNLAKSLMAQGYEQHDAAEMALDIQRRGDLAKARSHKYISRKKTARGWEYTYADDKTRPSQVPNPPGAKYHMRPFVTRNEQSGGHNYHLKEMAEHPDSRVRALGGKMREMKGDVKHPEWAATTAQLKTLHNKFHGPPQAKLAPMMGSGKTGAKIVKGGGWQPIPGGKHGGMRRRTARGYEYKYPSQEHAKRAHAHHEAKAKEYRRGADSIRHLSREHAGEYAMDAAEHDEAAAGAREIAAMNPDAKVSAKLMGSGKTGKPLRPSQAGKVKRPTKRAARRVVNQTFGLAITSRLDMLGAIRPMNNGNVGIQFGTKGTGSLAADVAAKLGPSEETWYERDIGDVHTWEISGPGVKVSAKLMGSGKTGKPLRPSQAGKVKPPPPPPKSAKAPSSPTADPAGYRRRLLSLLPKKGDKLKPWDWDAATGYGAMSTADKRAHRSILSALQDEGVIGRVTIHDPAIGEGVLGFERLKVHDRHGVSKSEALALARGEDPDMIFKAGGEGSRGGNVIGHSSSGKPIYASKDRSLAAKRHMAQAKAHKRKATSEWSPHGKAAIAHRDAAHAVSSGEKEHRTASASAWTATHRAKGGSGDGWRARTIRGGASLVHPTEYDQVHDRHGVSKSEALALARGGNLDSFAKSEDVDDILGGARHPRETPVVAGVTMGSVTYRNRPHVDPEAQRSRQSMPKAAPAPEVYVDIIDDTPQPRRMHGGRLVPPRLMIDD